MKLLERLLVIGLGSMGNRRLRLLKKLRPELCLCGVDISAERRAQAEAGFGIRTYAEIAQALQTEKPEAAVISTSPLTHASIIRECLRAGIHVFTELNLVADGYLENMQLAQEKKLVLFLSSTFLYRKENQYFIQRAHECDVPLNYRYHVGQYLPDWHPWENYKEYFVGNIRTNGCRELLAVELPWLCTAFGPIVDAQVLRQKCSHLQILYDDSYMLLLRHKSGCLGSLCIDVVSRKAVRQFELYGETMYLTWGGQPDTLIEWDIAGKREHTIQLYQQAAHQEGYAGFIIENAYEEELAAFFSQVEQNVSAAYGFAEDLETLQWIDRIEHMGADSPC